MIGGKEGRWDKKRYKTKRKIRKDVKKVKGKTKNKKNKKLRRRQGRDSNPKSNINRKRTFTIQKSPSYFSKHMILYTECILCLYTECWRRPCTWTRAWRSAASTVPTWWRCGWRRWWTSGAAAAWSTGQHSPGSRCRGCSYSSVQQEESLVISVDSFSLSRPLMLPRYRGTMHALGVKGSPSTCGYGLSIGTRKGIYSE